MVGRDGRRIGIGARVRWEPDETASAAARSWLTGAEGVVESQHGTPQGDRLVVRFEPHGRVETRPERLVVLEDQSPETEVQAS